MNQHQGQERQERPLEPASVAKLYKAHGEAKPRAIAIYCVDPRFQEATEQFLSEELDLPKGAYVPFALGGGVASLTEPLRLPKDAKYVRDLISFYADHFPTVSRIILVNHEDCGKYATLVAAVPLLRKLAGHVSDRQKDDLRRVTEMIQRFLPRQMAIERYYASFANSERTLVKFEKQ